VEFWIQTPKGSSLERACKKLSLGLGLEEEAATLASLKVDMAGRYTVHAYLYEDNGRLDYKSDSIARVK
jgi:hypothetical protein